MKWSSEELAQDPGRWVREQQAAAGELEKIWRRHAQREKSAEELEGMLNELKPGDQGSKTSKLRNQLVRRFALVIYRCHRGCFLGAVINYEGELFVCQRQNVRVTGGEVEVAPDTLEPRGVEPGSRLHEAVAGFVEELLTEEGWTRAHVAKMEVNPVGVTEAKQISGQGAPFHRVDPWEGFEGLVQMNCAHDQAALGVQQVAADIVSRKRERNKEVRLSGR